MSDVQGENYFRLSGAILKGDTLHAQIIRLESINKKRNYCSPREGRSPKKIDGSLLKKET